MCIHLNLMIFTKIIRGFISAQYKNIEEAENAGALYSVDIEYPMTLNDLSLLCESVAKAVGVPNGVKYQFVTQPQPEESDY
nr:hypothetical protein DFIBIBGI_00232 [Escherichia coli]